MQAVLQKNHTASLGPEVVVEEYGNSTQSTVASGTIPFPVESKEIPVDSLYLKSIALNPSALEQSLKMSEVTFSANEEKGMLVLSPKGKPKPDWHQECEKLVPDWLARMMKKEEVSITKEIAPEAKKLVTRLEKENPGLSFELSENETQLTIAGETSSVAQAKEALDNLCSELVVDEASVFLSPKGFEFLQQVKQHEFPNVQCTFDASKFSVILKGPNRDVAKLKASIESHSETVVMLDQMIIEFFNTQAGRGKLEKFLQDRECCAALYFSSFPLSLQLLFEPKETTKVRAIVEQLQLQGTSQAIPIPDSVLPIISELEEFLKLCKTTEEKYEVLIKQVDRKVAAAGFKEQVSRSLAEISASLVELSSPLPPLEREVSKMVAKSLHKSPQRLQACLQGLHLRCDPGRGCLVFTPQHYLKPGWEEICKSAVTDYIENNVAELKIPVPEKAYTEVMKELYTSEHDDNTFVYYYPPSSTSLSMAGEPSTVQLMKEKINQICASHSFIREEMPLQPENLDYLNQLKMEDIMSRFRGIEFETVPETHTLSISGPAKEVKKAKEYIPSITDSLTTLPVAIHEAIVQYFSTENGRERLLNLLRKKRCDKCALHLSDSPAKLSLVCSKAHKQSVKKAPSAITESTTMQPLDIPDLLFPFLSTLPEFTTMVTSLERELPAIIIMKGKNIVIAGFKDGVAHATETLSAFVKEKMTHYQPLSMEIDPMIAECIPSNLEGLQECMSTIHITCKLAKNSKVIMHPSKKTKPDWKEECQDLFNSYIAKEYPKETIEIPKEIAQDIILVLGEAKSTQNFHYEVHAESACATIAGKRNAVETVKIKVLEMCSKRQTTVIIQLSDREYDFFTQVVQMKLKLNCQVQLMPEKHSLSLTGSVHSVHNSRKMLVEAVKHEMVPASVDELVIKFIHTQGRAKLANMMHEEGIEAAIHIKPSVQPPVLEILCHKQFCNTVRELIINFPKQIETIHLTFPKTIAKPPVSHEFSEFCKELAMEHHVLITRKPDAILQICGFKDPVKKVEKAVERFIKIKCTISKAFSIPKGMWRLLGSEMKQKWVKIENICSNNEISLTRPCDEEEELVVGFKGDKSEVENVIETMNKLIQSIHMANVPLIRPEIQRYFSKYEDGGMKIPGIERNAHVCIEICTPGEDEKWGVEDNDPKEKVGEHTTKLAAPKMSKECTAQVVDMKRIIICVGDITEFRADVIVNAANEDLKHIGGVADAILKKGGQVIQDASNRYMRGRRSLNPGDVWLSQEVGQLPCLALIHAVGPRWQSNPSAREQLKKVCINILKAAKDYNSIALPAISSGVFGCPMNECAEIMISATVQFCKHQRSAFLDELYIVLLKESDVIHFVKALKDNLPAESIHRKSGGAELSLQTYNSSSPHKYEEFSQPSPSSYQQFSEEEEGESAEESQATNASSLSRILVKKGSILDVEVRYYTFSNHYSFLFYHSRLKYM